MARSAVVVAPGDNDYLLNAVRKLAIIFAFNGFVAGKRTLFIKVLDIYLPAVERMLELSSAVETVSRWR